MKSLSKTLFLSLSLLLPLAGCPSDSSQPEGPIFDACAADVDYAIDGTVDTRWRYQYENGLSVREENDIGLDGTIDEEYLTRYDADGHAIEFKYNLRGEDGTMALRYAQFETYDADGRLASREIDSNGDGLVTTRRTYFYDGEGRLSESRYDGGAAGPDGTVDSVTRSFYDAAGVRTHTETDHDEDGIAEDKTVYTSDAEGRTLRQEVDFGLDGVLDSVTTYAYEENGYLQRWSDDWDGDGVVDWEQIWTYAGDRPATIETSYGNPTSTPDLTTYDYACGDEKRVRAGGSESAQRIQRLKAGGLDRE